jgi:hypothetical protein
VASAQVGEQAKGRAEEHAKREAKNMELAKKKADEQAAAAQAAAEQTVPEEEARIRKEAKGQADSRKSGGRGEDQRLTQTPQQVRNPDTRSKKPSSSKRNRADARLGITGPRKRRIKKATAKEKEHAVGQSNTNTSSGVSLHPCPMCANAQSKQKHNRTDPHCKLFDNAGNKEQQQQQHQQQEDEDEDDVDCSGNDAATDDNTDENAPARGKGKKQSQRSSSQRKRMAKEAPGRRSSRKRVKEVSKKKVDVIYKGRIPAELKGKINQALSINANIAGGAAKFKQRLEELERGA